MDTATTSPAAVTAAGAGPDPFDFVDATPARVYVKMLQDAGIGLPRIREISGVGKGSLEGLIYGTRNFPPSRRIRRDRAEALLSIRPVLESFAPGCRVDASGTRRRLQALAVVGWPLGMIAVERGCAQQQITQLRHAELVTAATAIDIRDLYARLKDCPPVPSSPRQRTAITRTQAFARAQGWLGPDAWDVRSLDLPRNMRPKPALPAAGGWPDLTVRNELGSVDMVVVARRLQGDKTVEVPDFERKAAALELLRRGLPVHDIKQRISINPDTLAQIVAMFGQREVTDLYHRRLAERVRINGRWVHPAAPHGKRQGYVSFGCRCWPCTTANMAVAA